MVIPVHFNYTIPFLLLEKCYQCQYVPPKTTVKTIFKTETFTKQVSDPHFVLDYYQYYILKQHYQRYEYKL